jgi:hypothetical protein
MPPTGGTRDGQGAAAAAANPPRALEELECHKLEALALEAGDDVADQSALHAVGLDHHICHGSQGEGKR